MSANKNFKNYRVLVVDDSDFARAQLVALLSNSGFTVCGEASNGDEALRQVRDKKPHLVLTDIVMPEMSGVELAEKISTNYQQVGVIMVSSLHHEQIVLESIAAGAADFVPKPINPLQLTEAVEKYLTSIGAE